LREVIAIRWRWRRKKNGDSVQEEGCIYVAYTAKSEDRNLLKKEGGARWADSVKEEVGRSNDKSGEVCVYVNGEKRGAAPRRRGGERREKRGAIVCGKEKSVQSQTRTEGEGRALLRAPSEKKKQRSSARFPEQLRGSRSAVSRERETRCLDQRRNANISKGLVVTTGVREGTDGDSRNKGE